MSFRDHAPGLRALGFSVFPTHAPGMPYTKMMVDENGNVDEKQIGKAPLVKWKPFQTQRADDATFATLIKKFPKANIAICCGPVSGLLVLDIDGLDAMNALEALQDQHGDLPDTWRVGTSRGQHIYFTYHDDDLRNTNGVLGPGIESKTQGSTVHGAGSVHRSGHVYEWLSPFSPDECALAQAPEWLLERLRKKPEPEYEAPPATPRSPVPPGSKAAAREDSYKRKAWAAIIGELATAGEGGRNATLFRVAASAFKAVNAGVISQSEAEQALYVQARAIGLDSLEIKATIQSAFRKVGDTPMRLPDFTQSSPAYRNGKDGAPSAKRIEGPMPPEPPSYDEDSYGAPPPAEPDAPPSPPAILQLPAPPLMSGDEDVVDPNQGGPTPVWFDDDHDQQLPHMRMTTKYCATRSLTDLGNAQRLLAWFGENVMFSEGTDWMVWDGKRWRPDRQAIMRCAHKTAARINWEVEHGVDKAHEAAIRAWALKSMSSDKLSAMVNVAKSIRSFDPNKLDADPLLLNTMSGIVDLTTGMVRPHDPRAMLTKLVPYEVGAPEHTPEKFVKFLRDITCDDDEMLRYFQYHLGYSITGSIRHQDFYFYYGLGANGKGQLTELMLKIMGDYAVADAADLILDTKQMGNMEYRTIRLFGARALFLSELPADSALKVDTVKRFTGGDTLLGRHPYGRHIQFVPTHKVFLAANHRPNIGDQTNGTWRRMKLIPFDANFDDGREKILDIAMLLLKEEGPQILRWLIDGAVMDHALGSGKIPLPKRVSDATSDYKGEEDSLAEFTADTFDAAPDESESTREVYDAFKKWCVWRQDKRMGNWSQKFFNKLMAARGVRKSESNGRPMFRGLKFKPLSETAWRRESGYYDGDGRYN